MQNTLRDIQQSMIADLQALFADTKFISPTGEERELRFFAQEVPAPKGDDEDADAELISVPYCLVKVLDGSFQDWKYTRSINTVVIFCIYDASPEKTGHLTIMDMVDTAFKHYAEEPNIGNAHITLPIDWTIQTDVDTFPFFFGALELNLECASDKINISDLS